MGGTISKKIWDYLVPRINCYGSRIPPGSLEYISRLEVSKSEGLKQMETENKCTQKDFEARGTPDI